MALPNRLILDHFVYDNPLRYIRRLELSRERYTKNIYVPTWFSARKLRTGTCNKMVGKVFMSENKTYKIIAFETIRNNINSKFFTIEEYTDEYIEKLKERLERIREHIAVCTDCIEDLGTIGAANKLRKLAKEIRLEDMI